MVDLLDPAYDWGQLEAALYGPDEPGVLSLLDLYAGVIPPALDWSLPAPVEVHMGAIDLVVLAVPPPPVVTPDPDTTPPLPEPALFGMVHEVWACRPVSHQPICHLTTATVQSYSETWEGGDAEVTVSAWDPALDLIPDFDGFEIMIACDGALVWAGVCNQPIDIGDDLVSITGSNAAVILDQNTLGAVEQPDFYNGAGRFNGGADGWAKIDEPEEGLESPLLSVAHSTFDPWEGSGCLEVQGVGWFAGPWVSMPGHPNRVRHPQGSAFLKCPSGVLGIETQVQEGGEYVRPDFARANARSVDAENGWQGLVATKGWLPGGGGLVRIAGYVASKDKCYIDFARITWGTLSGSTVPIPISSYPGIIMGDAQNTGIGGHPYGISVAVDSPVTARIKRAWAHHDNHPVGELMRELADMYGGPDIWVDNRFTLRVAARRGSIRGDVLLDEHTILDPSWTHDPGARVNELIGLTEFGSGATRAARGTAYGTNGYNHREITQAPAGMSYDTAGEWVTGLAGPKAAPQRTATWTVPWWVGATLNVGDSVQVAAAQGRLGWSGWVRVTAVTMLPETCTASLEVGLDQDL